MKRLIISEEEKKKIIEQYQTPPSDANEQIIWDKGNLGAIKSYQKMGQPDRKFIIKVEEPFELETTDSEEFYKLKHILIKTHTKFTDDIQKID
jgi:hypothetical protein